MQTELISKFQKRSN